MSDSSFLEKPKMNFDEVVQRKILTHDQLHRWLSWWRMQSRKIVFTNGVFDILHRGHIHILNSARSFGDIVIVGLNTNASVRKIKPGRPINDEASRAILLASLEVVDAVVLFNEETPLQLITEIKPDVLVKGGDYKAEDVVGKDVVDANGGRVEIVPLLKDFSTTNILNKLTNEV
ncbi:MAG: D-glycero-beta-D-manno-heptose 1-phosphate adenylyltransferase [Chitinophagales bacterium]